MNCLEKPEVLLGCGILAREVKYIIEKNGWNLDTDFLPSSLHMDLTALAEQLSAGLKRNHDRNTVVFYGCCHPLMDRILMNAHANRTRGRNCIEMLLGTELYESELNAGAFFLLDEWAWNWDELMTSTFGPNREVLAEIMQLDRKFLLAIRTPCSEDFTEVAEIASHQTGLPLRWLDTDLTALEAVLREALSRPEAVS